MNKDGDRFKLEIKKFTSCLFLIANIMILSCVKEEKVEDSYSAKYSLAQLLSEAYTCYQPNSIEIPEAVGRYSGRNCLTNVVSSGFIFNADTKEELGMEIKAADNTKLNCRTKEDETALRSEGLWYKSAIINPPPPGLRVEFLYDHGNRANFELAANGVPLRSKPLTNYAPNHTLYCFTQSSGQGYSDLKYQKLIVR